jgi:hypothetical protein
VKRFENHKAPTKKTILNQKVINEGEASMDSKAEPKDKIRGGQDFSCVIILTKII